MLRRSGHAASLALAVLVFAAVSAFAARGEENAAPEPDGSSRSHSIVDGMRIQPRASDLERSNRSDVDEPEAKEIDEINRRLLGPDPDQHPTRPAGSRRNDTPRIDAVPAPAKE
jgi:hypothetical protein